MGPGSFDPGNVVRDAEGDRGRQASMGPGFFDPGNLDACGKTKPSKSGSNGAGIIRSRKCVGDVELLVVCGLLQWGRDHSIPEMSNMTTIGTCYFGFNGAGIIRSRK